MDNETARPAVAIFFSLLFAGSCSSPAQHTDRVLSICDIAKQQHFYNGAFVEVEAISSGAFMVPSSLYDPRCQHASMSLSTGGAEGDDMLRGYRSLVLDSVEMKVFRVRFQGTYKRTPDDAFAVRSSHPPARHGDIKVKRMLTFELVTDYWVEYPSLFKKPWTEEEAVCDYDRFEKCETELGSECTVEIARERYGAFSERPCDGMPK